MSFGAQHRERSKFSDFRWTRRYFLESSYPISTNNLNHYQPIRGLYMIPDIADQQQHGELSANVTLCQEEE